MKLFNVNNEKLQTYLEKNSLFMNDVDNEEFDETDELTEEEIVRILKKVGKLEIMIIGLVNIEELRTVDVT